MEKKPSEQWKEYLHDNQSLEKANRVAYDLYKDKYARHNPNNTPQEKVTKKLFIPGKIYTFLYTTMARPNPDRPYIDRRPVLLSLGQIVQGRDMYEVGIDLMLVPPKLRIFILDAVYKFFKHELTENMKNLDEGRKAEKAMKLNYETAKKVFHKLGWEMAFQTFNKVKIAGPMVLDYADWVATIALYTKGIEGKQINAIYDNYIKKLLNPSEPVNEMEENKKKNQKAQAAADKRAAKQSGQR